MLVPVQFLKKNKDGTYLFAPAFLENKSLAINISKLPYDIWELLEVGQIYLMEMAIGVHDR